MTPKRKFHGLQTLLALLVALTPAIGLAPAAVAQAQAGGPPHPRPNLIHAAPTHGRRPKTTPAGPGQAVVLGGDNNPLAAAPGVTVLCQTYMGGVNPYANPAPNVDEINGDPLMTHGVDWFGNGIGCNASQNEPTIAVNPRNPKNLVGGSNAFNVFTSRENNYDVAGVAYTSFDGGQTWTDAQLPHLTFETGATGPLFDMDAAGDPSVAFGPHNTVYYANIDFSRFRVNRGSSIVVSTSHDGGRTWGEPSIVISDGVDALGNPTGTDYFNDKDWIAVDQRTGAIYVTWTRKGPTSTPIVVSVSHDGGATWSAPVQVNPAFTPGGLTPYSQGSIPQVGPDGTLYVAYEGVVCQSLNCDQPADHDVIAVARSKDGGQTFTNVVVNPDYDFPWNLDIAWFGLTGENLAVNGFPSFAVDPADGQMYLTWADDRNGQYDASGNSIKTDGDVFVMSSGNGQNWSAPIRLGTSADDFFPAVAVNDGRVAVSFYTRAYDPNGIGLDMAYVGGGRGALKKNKVTRITTQTENPQVQSAEVGIVTGNLLQGTFIGDYLAAALGSDGVFHPSWTDFRGKPGTTLPNQDIYTQAIPLPKSDD
jgi:hypothetical protein